MKTLIIFTVKPVEKNKKFNLFGIFRNLISMREIAYKKNKKKQKIISSEKFVFLYKIYRENKIAKNISFKG